MDNIIEDIFIFPGYLCLCLLLLISCKIEMYLNNNGGIL